MEIVTWALVTPVFAKHKSQRHNDEALGKQQFVTRRCHRIRSIIFDPENEASYSIVSKVFRIPRLGIQWARSTPTLCCKRFRNNKKILHATVGRFPPVRVEDYGPIAT